MPIRFYCPAGHRLSISHRKAGELIRCPTCMRATIVPASGLSEKAPDAIPAPRRAKLAVPAEKEALAASPIAELEPVDPIRVAVSNVATPASLPVDAPPTNLFDDLVVEMLELPSSPLGKASAAFVERSPDIVEPPIIAEAIVAPPVQFNPNESLASQWKSDAPATVDAPAQSPAQSKQGGATSSPSEREQKQSERHLERAKQREERSKNAMRGYRASPRWKSAVEHLALGLGGLALFSLVPVIFHLDLTMAPGWVKVVALLSALELAYAAWMLLVPDWSAPWMGMIVLGVVATVYSMGFAITLSMSPYQTNYFDMATLKMEQGMFPAIWCGAIIVCTALLAYRCGLTSHRWELDCREAWARGPRHARNSTIRPRPVRR